GKVTAAVPWARHDDRFSMPFEEHAAWLAANGPWTKVCRQLRITWDAVAWMGEGRCQATVEKFFTDLGPERAKMLTDVSADGAEWIHDVVRAKAPQALISVDAFHVVLSA